MAIKLKESGVIRLLSRGVRLRPADWDQLHFDMLDGTVVIKKHSKILHMSDALIYIRSYCRDGVEWEVYYGDS